MRTVYRLLLLLTALACFQSVHAAWVSGEEAIMGTRISVQLWHQDKDQGKAAIEAVMEEFRRLDRN